MNRLIVWTERLEDGMARWRGQSPMMTNLLAGSFGASALALMLGWVQPYVYFCPGDHTIWCAAFWLCLCGIAG